MRHTHRGIDRVRGRSSALENNLIDDYVAGKMGRREFLRRGTVLGLSLPTLGFLLSACGANDGEAGQDQQQSTSSTAAGQPKQGGTLRVAIYAPTSALDPVTVGDSGGLTVLGQTGEFLTWSQGDLTLRPVLAEKWSPDATGQRWIFNLRPGVKFHDGQTMTARDVVATFDRLVEPTNKSNALSAFRGVLKPGGTRAVDDLTVEFNLDAPNGNFPYLVSSDNYNSIILPASYSGDWEKSFVGTGPFRLDSYTPKARVSFVRNPDYWGRPANPDRLEFTFYPDEGPQVVALQGRQVDVLGLASVSGSRAILNDPNVAFSELKAVTHRQMHMRTDQEPFTDKRVRQAVALLVDREGLVQGLFQGKADLGNDSPFAPAFPSTDRTVAQRRRDVAKAKQLLADAGKGGGFTVPLNAIRELEVPDLAQLVQSNVKEAGINLDLTVQDGSTYYGEAVFGQSPWLDSVMGITDYGHRGVPNVYLNAPLVSTGTWNAAHFKNAQYDQLVKDYTAALELDAQRSAAGKIQQLLLDETPIVIPYFYYFLTATQKAVAGLEVTAMGHLNLAQAGLT